MSTVFWAMLALVLFVLFWLSLIGFGLMRQASKQSREDEKTELYFLKQCEQDLPSAGADPTC
jgi:uncharacterized protein (DUF58 family)